MRSTLLRRAPAALLGLLLLLAGGCGSPSHLKSAQRLRYGMVFVLPGIEGSSIFSRNVAIGLSDGGVRSAIEVFDWTGIPLVGNLSLYSRNLRQAAELADRIKAYQAEHPGRPVHVIGHSGGGGIAVLALEALPPQNRIDQAILLAPALSPEYNLTRALRRTRAGILNLYSEKDVSLLKVGTTIMGAIDRERGPAAGAIGFALPEDLNARGRSVYAERLRQVRWQPRLKKLGASGTHLGWASRKFARMYLAKLVRLNEEAARRLANRPERRPQPPPQPEPPPSQQEEDARDSDESLRD